MIFNDFYYSEHFAAVFVAIVANRRLVVITAAVGDDVLVIYFVAFYL